MQELTMILLWEDELGSKEPNFPPRSFLPTNLAFQTRTYISNFPNSLDIEHFLTASTRYWSISNILREIDCSSKIKVWTSIDPWQHLSPVRSKSWSEVEKLDSHAGLDCVLKIRQNTCNTAIPSRKRSNVCRKTYKTRLYFRENAESESNTTLNVAMPSRKR